MEDAFLIAGELIIDMGVGLFVGVSGAFSTVKKSALAIAHSVSSIAEGGKVIALGF